MVYPAVVVFVMVAPGFKRDLLDASVVAGIPIATSSLHVGRLGSQARMAEEIGSGEQARSRRDVIRDRPKSPKRQD